MIWSLNSGRRAGGNTVRSKHRPLVVMLLTLLPGVASLASAQDAPPAPSPVPAAGAPAPGAPPAAEAPPAPAAAAQAALPEAAVADLQAAKDAYKQGNWQAAMDAARKVITVAPKDQESLYIAGASEGKTGHFGDGEGHLRALIEA